MQLNERIAKARAHRNLSQSQLALMMGVSRGACGQWEQGVSTPNTEHLISLAQLLEVSFEWLSTGRGPMEYVNEVREQGAAYSTQPNISPELKAMIVWIQRQPESKQRAILRMLKAMIELSSNSSKD